jgi:hypothetical protein
VTRSEELVQGALRRVAKQAPVRQWQPAIVPGVCAVRSVRYHQQPASQSVRPAPTPLTPNPPGSYWPNSTVSVQR